MIDIQRSDAPIFIGKMHGNCTADTRRCTCYDGCSHEIS